MLSPPHDWITTICFLWGCPWRLFGSSEWFQMQLPWSSWSSNALWQPFSTTSPWCISVPKWSAGVLREFEIVCLLVVPLGDVSLPLTAWCALLTVKIYWCALTIFIALSVCCEIKTQIEKHCLMVMLCLCWYSFIRLFMDVIQHAGYCIKALYA